MVWLHCKPATIPIIPMKSAGALSRPRLQDTADSIAWIFRSNLPPYRGAPLRLHQKRNFFGLGEILSVLANPGKTLKSLTEARRSLEEARKEIRESCERAQLRTTHTFAPFPGFFHRPAELQTIRRILEGPPTFTVLSGASSVGKTALLREVLSEDRYHVLHFDLRIAGFADISSLYTSLSKQLEEYFITLSRDEGYGEFEKDAWAFKHDRLAIEKRIESSNSPIVNTSDIARLLELFQSSLLHYWIFTPKFKVDNNSHEESNIVSTDQTNVLPRDSERSTHQLVKQYNEKKVPVMFFDEAHKLPVLVRSNDAMKCLLDAMLVLTKQDRLCHVVHATSDGFFQTWLRQLNIMQHCKIICIGDCSKCEVSSYFNERLMAGVPETLRSKLDFDTLYDAFGGKLVHWADYITDFVNNNGDITVERSSHFQQAYSLINLHLIRALDMESASLEKRQNDINTPNQMTQGSKNYTPSPAQTLFTCSNSMYNDESRADILYPAFTAQQLFDVMYRLSQDNVHAIAYFELCRAYGMNAVNDMVHGRLLELRWSDSVTTEGGMRAMSVAGAEDPGPKLLPTTPIIAYAMRRVLRDYEYDPGQEETSGEQAKRHESRVISAHRWRKSSGVHSDDKSDYVSLSEVSEY